MILESIIRVKTEKEGVVKILSDDTPSSLTISGADVDGLPDDYVISPGSVIITPEANYICFSESGGDSIFIEKTYNANAG